MANDSGHGGKRAGSGRKLGSKNLKSRQFALNVNHDDVTPLEILMAGMRHAASEGDWRKATSLAKDAAPYCHPRLSAIAHGSTDELTHKKSEPMEPLELARRVAFLFCVIEERQPKTAPPTPADVVHQSAELVSTRIE